MGVHVCVCDMSGELSSRNVGNVRASLALISAICSDEFVPRKPTSRRTVKTKVKRESVATFSRIATQQGNQPRQPHSDDVEQEQEQVQEQGVGVGVGVG